MALTQVSTDGVKNDAITKTKIPANQIETSELANNSVTLGKLFQGTTAGFIATSNGSDCTVPTYPSFSGDTVIVHDLQCEKDSSNVNPVIGAAGGGTNLTFRTNQNGSSGAGLASILDLTGLQLGRMNEYVKLAAPTDQSGQTSYTFTFPVAGGSNGQFLKTDGNGTTSWDTVTGTTINNNDDNKVITATGTANTLQGEPYLFQSGASLSIGTGSPTYSANLHIRNSYASMRIDSDGSNNHTDFYNVTGSGTQNRIHFGDSADNDVGGIIYDHNDDHMRFVVAAAERIRIRNNGAGSETEYGLKFSDSKPLRFKDNTMGIATATFSMSPNTWTTMFSHSSYMCVEINVGSVHNAGFSQATWLINKSASGGNSLVRTGHNNAYSPANLEFRINGSDLQIRSSYSTYGYLHCNFVYGFTDISNLSG